MAENCHNTPGMPGERSSASDSMSNVTHIGQRPNSIVSQVSVQVSEYSEENGGTDPGTGRLFAVETLFTDGKWNPEGYHRTLPAASEHAAQVAKDRGAVLLEKSLWPNRQVKGGAA